jgi:hypothetical protein
MLLLYVQYVSSFVNSCGCTVQVCCGLPQASHRSLTIPLELPVGYGLKTVIELGNHLPIQTVGPDIEPRLERVEHFLACVAGCNARTR